MDKKSQGGTKAAALVAIIMALIILYILFMPPSERERLLYNKTTNETGGDVEEEGKTNITLLLEHPGLLEYLPTTEYEKSIPSLSLYTKTEAEIVKSQDFVTVKNSWITSKKYELKFSISDLDNAENFILNFNVDKAEGNLRIELNDKLIYDKEATGANVVLKLEKEDVKEENMIVFSASSVGLKFWSSNIYELQNIQVVADITDKTKQASKNRFILSTTETINLERSHLRFYVDCAQKLDLDNLEVLINNHIIYSQLPVCGDYVLQGFDPSILISGENMIEFRTQFLKQTTAYYTLDNILIRLELKEPTHPTYYFDISSSRFNKVTEGAKKIYMRMLFTDDIERKKAELRINGIETNLDTKDREFLKDISDFVKKDSNAIKIIPKTSLEIIDLRVSYE